MIRITIELIPHGVADHPRRRVIGQIDVENDGTGTEALGNYLYEVHHAGKFWGKGVWKRGRIKNFARHLSPYRLISRILKDAKEV